MFPRLIRYVIGTLSRPHGLVLGRMPAPSFYFAFRRLIASTSLLPPLFSIMTGQLPVLLFLAADMANSDVFAICFLHFTLFNNL